MVDLAKEAFSTKNFDLAVEIYQRTISENGPSFELYLGLADSNARSGQLEEAFTAYTKAFRLGGGNLSPSKLQNLVIGLVDYTAKLHKGFKSIISKASKLEMFDCVICCGLIIEPVTLPCGHTFCRACLVKDGTRTCRTCGKVHFYLCHKSYRTNILISSTLDKLFPNDVLAATYKSAGNKYFTSGKSVEAIEEYTKALKYAPNDHLIASNRSAAYSALEKFQDALDDANLCVQIRPDWPKGYFRKAKALSDLGRKEEACYAYLQCLVVDPNVSVAKEALGKELHKLLTPRDSVTLKHGEMQSHATSSLSDLLNIQSLSQWIPTAGNILQLRASIQTHLGSSGDDKRSLSAPVSRGSSPAPDIDRDEEPVCGEDLERRGSLKRTRNSSDDGANCSELKVSKSETDVSTSASSENLKRKVCLSSLDSQDFECALCFRLFYEPVTTPCGHTFCRSCLDRALDHNANCPLCKGSLAEYLAGGRHTRVEIIENLLKAAFPKQLVERKTVNEEEMAALNHSGSGLQEIPIFVCTNAYPSVTCPLHVFEPRYRLMIRQCMEAGTRQFGMAIALTENESDFSEYGTMLEIRDVQYFPDGRSVVDCIGGRRFRVKERGTREGYSTAKIELLTDSVPEESELQGVRNLCQEVYNLSKHWFENLPNEMRGRINQSFGEFPEMDSDLPLEPNGPKWPWWILNVLPLHPRTQVTIIAMCSFKDRLSSLKNALTYLNRKRSQ